MSMQEVSSRLWFLFTNYPKPSYSVNYQGLVEANEEHINKIHNSEQVSKSIGIVGSCNGLVSLYVDYDEGIILWNPSTGEVRKLSLSPLSLSGCYERHFHGLGYDSLTDDYKYIMGYLPRLQFGGAAEVTVEFFPLKSNSWRRVEYELDVFGFDLFDTGVYCCGSLHWKLTLSSKTIASFNLAKEEFYNVIEMPSVDKNFYARSLGVLGECLFIIYLDPVKFHYEVWMMKEYGDMSSWSKLCSFSLPISRDWFGVVSITRAGKVVFDCGEGDVCIFNPEKNTGSICKLPNVAAYDRRTLYVESLVSPYGVR